MVEELAPSHILEEEGGVVHWGLATKEKVSIGDEVGDKEFWRPKWLGANH